MNLALFLTGLVLLLLSIADLLYTAFSSRGAGFITGFNKTVMDVFSFSE